MPCWPRVPARYFQNPESRVRTGIGTVERGTDVFLRAQTPGIVPRAARLRLCEGSWSSTGRERPAHVPAACLPLVLSRNRRRRCAVAQPPQAFGSLAREPGFGAGNDSASGDIDFFFSAPPGSHRVRGDGVVQRATWKVEILEMMINRSSFLR